ncbi:hypothetical protein C8R46DRAFT_678042 [Mycena filopes]|nr:hypothetical protein C8R46DRAFT_678042 [Mycena filopes]
MAEIVGVLASVLQLVDMVTKARGYLKGVHDASEDQQRLFAEVHNVQILLRELDNRIRTNKVSRLSIGLQELEGPLNALRGTMMRLTEKLRPGAFKISSHLTWPLWGKEDVHEGLSEIERFKGLINVWFGLDIWDAAQDTIAVVRDTAEAQRVDHQYLAKSVRDVALNQTEYHSASERDKVIEWYSPLNFFRRQADIFSTHQAGTGGWFLETDLINEWILYPGKAVACPGIPGAGKTVLVSILVNDLRTNPERGVAVIYLHHKEIEAQSPPSLLAGVWRQLIFKRSIPSTVCQLYNDHREQCTRPTLDETYSVLCCTVAEFSEVFIVVDALDEYPEDQRDVLLHCLTTLGANVHLLFTCRPHINLDHIICPDDLETLEIRANEDDIRRYIDAQIARSWRLSRHVKSCPELRIEIQRRIAARSDGIFLIAKLNIEALVTKHTVKAVRDSLKNMPGDLNSTYDDVMKRINRQGEDDRTLARRTLSWVSHAETVLHISELIEALAVEPGTTALDPGNLLDADIILSVCAGLVVIDDEDHLVRLIHYTAQDYLDGIRESGFPDAQIEITSTCVTYLMFDIFAECADEVLEDQMDEHPLLEYALLLCLIHGRGGPEFLLKDDILRFLAHLTNCDRRGLWQIMHKLHISLPQTRLGIASYFGMLEVARHLLDEDGFDIGALRGATINGHTQLVRLLMQSRGYRNHVAQASDRSHPKRAESSAALQGAALQGDEERVNLLLERGADVNGPTEPYGSSLQAASVAGHYPVVCLLLAYGADVNSQNGIYGTALRAASLAGHADVVFLLIEHGADIDAEGGKEGGALAAALSCGRDEVAELLIERGANVNGPGARGWTVLGLAAGNGHLEVVRLLLQKGANVNAHSAPNKTAVRAALCGGHARIASLLIEEGAESAVDVGG